MTSTESDFSISTFVAWLQKSLNLTTKYSNKESCASTARTLGNEMSTDPLENHREKNDTG
jgi:hypothetical protein